MSTLIMGSPALWPMGIAAPDSASVAASSGVACLTMLIIAGSLRVDAADRAAYLGFVARATAMARETPGCLDFAQSADPLEPDRINIFERWESDAALQAFRDLPSDEESVPPIRTADVRRYRISAVEDA